MGSRNANSLEATEVLLQYGAPPVTQGVLERGRELGWCTAESLSDGLSELLCAPECTVGDIDVDGQTLVKLVVQDGAEGGKDAFEGLHAASKIKTLFTTLKERLLDLSVLLGRPLAHDVIEEIDRVDAVSGPGCLTAKESLEVDEVDLACPAKMNRMLVAASTRPGGSTLFSIEVDRDAGIITTKALSGPSELVAIPDPEVGWLSELLLDSWRVPDLFQEHTLGVIQSITRVIELEHTFSHGLGQNKRVNLRRTGILRYWEP